MTRNETAPTGAPCWVDLFSSDLDRSLAFYTELFGWTAEAPAAEFGGYVNIDKDGIRVAGAMTNDGSSGAPDAWSVYLSTPDAQKTIDAATNGGSQVIVPAMAVGDLGTMGVVTDPGGAAIGMWQPGAHKGYGVFDEPGSVSWCELHTREYDASVAFYRSVFKWDAHTVADSPEFRYTTFGKDETSRAGIIDASSFLPAESPSTWFVYFGTDDADKTLARATEQGGSVIQAAEDTPYGRLATAADPTGAVFKLRQNL